MRFLSLLTSAAVCSLASTAYATQQVPEAVIVDREKSTMLTTPLEDFFNKERPKPATMGPLSTACYRGYIGTWEIKDGSLFLLKVERRSHGGTGEEVVADIPLATFFPKADEPVKAEWFTGVLRIAKGEVLYRSFNPIHVRTLYATVKKGRITSKRIIDAKREGATLSPADIDWVSLADDKAVADDGDWIDARLIAKTKPKGGFKTRGRFHRATGGEPAMLVIPNTPTTQFLRIEVEGVPEETEDVDGAHVEITVTKIVGREIPKLKVGAIRPLVHGESMHHPAFE